MADIDSVVEEFRLLLRQDGADAIVRSADESLVSLELVLDRVQCVDCVMPREYLEQLFEAMLAEESLTTSRVVMQDPREGTLNHEGS